jgi:hypothetical protein
MIVPRLNGGGMTGLDLTLASIVFATCVAIAIVVRYITEEREHEEGNG